jgi:tetrahydrodipicolinate N-succinyltransferase
LVGLGVLVGVEVEVGVRVGRDVFVGAEVAVAAGTPEAPQAEVSKAIAKRVTTIELKDLVPIFSP